MRACGGSEQFMQALFGRLPEFFRDEDELRRLWSDPATRRALLATLAERGFGRAQLGEMQRLIEAEQSDLFDVRAYVAWARAPLIRAVRAEHAREAPPVALEPRQRIFLEFVLDQYVFRGVEELDQDKLPPLLTLKYHALADATAELGPADRIRALSVDFQKYLYEPSVQ
jgi:type I restriction enzyme R subunit